MNWSFSRARLVIPGSHIPGAGRRTRIQWSVNRTCWPESTPGMWQATHPFDGRDRTDRGRGRMGHLVPGFPCCSFPGHLVAAQTDPLVDRGIRGRPGMGIVTRDTRQSPLTPLEAARLRQADRLESGQGRIVCVEPLRRYPAGMPMATAAKLELALDRPAFQPHGHREIFRPGSASSRLDMGSARSMTPLAGDAGNHRQRIKLPAECAESWVA